MVLALRVEILLWLESLLDLFALSSSSFSSSPLFLAYLVSGSSSDGPSGPGRKVSFSDMLEVKDPASAADKGASWKSSFSTKFPNSSLSSGKENEIAVECEGRDADGAPPEPEGNDCTESMCTVDSAGTMISGIGCVDGLAISVCVDDWVVVPPNRDDAERTSLPQSSLSSLACNDKRGGRERFSFGNF